MTKKKIAIIGGGSAGIFAAERFCYEYDVTIYEKGKTIGRKFLVAGKGGFNLTNQASREQLTQQYLPHDFFDKKLLEFDSEHMRQWLSDLGIPTFVGTSGRVFPEKGIKPIEVLKKIKSRLQEQDVQFKYHHEFIGFDEKDKVIVKYKDALKNIDADFVIFALGGASWSVTGSDGRWLKSFEELEINTIPFQSSNCGVNMVWPTHFKNHHAGKPLKNIEVSIGDKKIKGEALITEYGLEGNAIYPIIPEVRTALNNNNSTILNIDLKPNVTAEKLLQKIKNKPVKTKSYAQALNLNSTQIAIIKSFSEKENFLKPTVFIDLVKHLQIPIQSLRPIEEAISTIGGIDLEEVNEKFSLKKYPNIYVIGEMLNWDAPTGGFLLQGCYTMAQSIKIDK